LNQVPKVSVAPMISIVVASYNYETFIEQTLKSIAAQTLSNWEALVVDDGSTDNSLAVIRKFCEMDARFRLLQHEGGRNRGLAESLQLGIRRASAKWVAFCESDDWWARTFLEELSDRAQRCPRSGVLFSDVILEGTSATMEAHCVMVREHFRQGGQATELYRTMRNAVPTMSCAMVRAELIRECNFQARFAPSLDMWLWAQLVVETDFEFIDKPLCHWRQHDASYMKKEVNPATLDMEKVWQFHADIRGLLRRGSPVRAVRNSLRKLKLKLLGH
jgi:glycosyltransferase involved in cell wall biosynthesis